MARFDDLPPSAFEALAAMLGQAGSTPAAVGAALRGAADRDLVAGLALSWADEAASAGPESLGPEASEEVRRRAMEGVRAACDRHARAPRTATGVRLSDLAAACGRSLAEIGAAAGLNASLVGGLAARRFDPDTVPRRVARRVAGLLGVGAEEVAATWTGAPRPMMAARGGPAHDVGGDDFAAAVSASDLPAERKADLLGLAG